MPKLQICRESKGRECNEIEAEVKDVSDDSWEEIDHPSSEDGLIDLDAAIV
jgi:hypothetical protein